MLVKNKTSPSLRRQADLLMKKTGVVDTLKKYGQVCIGGSYELDLMVDGDIDIYVFDSQLSKNRSLRCFNELIRADKFRGYIFYDFVNRRKIGFPKGYYLGAKTQVRGAKWKVDIWFMKARGGVNDQFMKKVVAGLDNARREKILELKKIIKDKKIELPSFVIYNAVIEGAVDNMKKLIKFASKEGYHVSR